MEERSFRCTCKYIEIDYNTVIEIIFYHLRKKKRVIFFFLSGMHHSTRKELFFSKLKYKYTYSFSFPCTILTVQSVHHPLPWYLEQFRHAICNTFLCGGQSGAWRFCWKVCWSPDALSHVTGPSQGETSVILDSLWRAEQEAALEYEFHICSAATIISSPREYELLQWICTVDRLATLIFITVFANVGVINPELSAENK